MNSLVEVYLNDFFGCTSLWWTTGGLFGALKLRGSASLLFLFWTAYSSLFFGFPEAFLRRRQLIWRNCFFIYVVRVWINWNFTIFLLWYVLINISWTIFWASSLCLYYESVSSCSNFIFVDKGWVLLPSLMKFSFLLLNELLEWFCPLTILYFHGGLTISLFRVWGGSSLFFLRLNRIFEATLLVLIIRQLRVDARILLIS